MKYKLDDNIKKALRLLNYTEFTDVQKEVLPEIFKGNDVLVKSATGSGKTASFAIPICDKILWDDNAPQALVLTPTRELALQIKEDFFNIGRFKRIKTSALYGKESFARQAKEIKQKTHVVVGTPGRVFDHIERGSLDLHNIKYLVLDEADELLAMGFIEEVSRIIESISKQRVTILLSATINDEIKELSSKYMKAPVIVEIEEEIKTVDKIEQYFYDTTNESKKKLLLDLFKVENPDSAIIFANTQVAVDDLHEFLYKKRFTVKKIHGGMEQSDRIRVMNDFKRGKFRCLIATDVAARGIDVANISLVINYDFPKKPATYVHRIGRTGRINNEGKALTFLTDIGRESFKDLRRFLDKELIFKDAPSESEVRLAENAFIKKMSSKPLEKEDKGANLAKDILKIHINAGKKTKMRAVDVVGTLCNIDGMTADDIGIINILDVSTFVEILHGKGELVFEALKTKPLKGRIRTISKVLDE